jgi:hypothetical protein
MAGTLPKFGSRPFSKSDIVVSRPVAVICNVMIPI